MESESVPSELRTIDTAIYSDPVSNGILFRDSPLPFRHSKYVSEQVKLRLLESSVLGYLLLTFQQPRCVTAPTEFFSRLVSHYTNYMFTSRST